MFHLICWITDVRINAVCAQCDAFVCDAHPPEFGFARVIGYVLFTHIAVFSFTYQPGSNCPVCIAIEHSELVSITEKPVVLPDYWLIF